MRTTGFENGPSSPTDGPKQNNNYNKNYNNKADTNRDDKKSNNTVFEVRSSWPELKGKPITQQGGIEGFDKARKGLAPGMNRLHHPQVLRKTSKKW